MENSFDVVVVGSGAAGVTAALRAKESGLSVVVVDKAPKFGGTSATSGGVIWLPNHGLPGSTDTREETFRYLDAVVAGPVRRDRLEAFVDGGPALLRFLAAMGMTFSAALWPDYFSEAPGARSDRSIVFKKFDGTELGEHFHLMREQFTRFKLFNRYAMDFEDAFMISSRAPGWRRRLLRLLTRYWLDISVRRRTSRDRWCTMGGALVGPIVKMLLERGVEIRLDTGLDKLLFADGRVCGVEVRRFGSRSQITARHGVVICAGGFEWNQLLRERYLTVPGSIRWSSTPEDANRGEALEAALDLGADVEFTETAWMVPTMSMPIKGVSNFEEVHQAVFDVGRPHGVCVNRNGVRFVDESCGYDRFGNAMIEDQLKTGANTPCWLVFDATFRRLFTAGGFMPSAIMPDRSIPPDWWDHYIFKADSVDGLAAKIGVNPQALADTVRNMNRYARTGIDPEFGRGSNPYDQFFGDPSAKPNPCLGAIETPPYYAIPINLGDLGTKGGLKADAKARVLDRDNRLIPGLYAAGNASGSPFGNCYPGAGGTIGPGMVFGFLAANDIASRVNKTAAIESV